MTAEKDGEVWNATHIEPSSQVRIPLRIYLEHDRLSAHLCSSAQNLRSCHPARTTPGGPEIDQHRDARLLDDLVEQLRIYFQRLTNGTQRCFAGSAPSRIRKMLGGNAVLSTTCLTGSKDGHKDLLSTTRLP